MSTAPITATPFVVEQRHLRRAMLVGAAIILIGQVADWGTTHLLLASVRQAVEANPLSGFLLRYGWLLPVKFTLGAALMVRSRREPTWPLVVTTLLVAGLYIWVVLGNVMLLVRY